MKIFSLNIIFLEIINSINWKIFFVIKFQFPQFPRLKKQNKFKNISQFSNSIKSSKISKFISIFHILIIKIFYLLNIQKKYDRSFNKY
jgi:hypothetical protein